MTGPGLALVQNHLSPPLTRRMAHRLGRLRCIAVNPRLDNIRSKTVSAKVVLVAACALIDADGRVLIAQRPPGKPMAGLWEFPGGKVDPGERPEDALIRELEEELGIAVKEACLAPLTFASHTYEDFHLLMPLYVCRRWEGIVSAREGQTLAWVRPNRLKEYPMPPADVPLISHLTTLL
jgi:8-oxo-dGTP diphosphatase